MAHRRCAGSIGADLEPGLLLARIAELIVQLLEAKACSGMLIGASSSAR